MSSNSINGYQIYNSFISGYSQIYDDREEINRVNVFPVADGDTGNNLARTVKLIVTRLEPNRSAFKVLESIASLSLDSARGNSGLIFSQFLNGLAISTNGKESLTIEDFSKAAINASLLAYEAVENPVEGTILTILKIWSTALHELSSEIKNIEIIFEKAFHKAKEALLNTKNQLAILKEKDVIDAGAMGFVSFLEGINTLQKNGFVNIDAMKK
ncbi:MAG: DAK2 domain-containing protein, partial [Spirochaetales bacterium]|nr:DAK2 domain-containing protein [Spirochaetales bacterium]